MTQAGVPIKFRAEKIIDTVIDFTNRSLGQSCSARLKISLSGNVKGVAITDAIRKGDVLSINARMEKKRGIKEDAKKMRSFIALINKSMDVAAVDEYEQNKDVVEKEFLH